MKLTDQQKQEVDNFMYCEIQDNLNDPLTFEDYWWGMTCSDGRVLDVNIYDTEVYGIDEDGLRCCVYDVDDDSNPIYEDIYIFESKHLKGIERRYYETKR